MTMDTTQKMATEKRNALARIEQLENLVPNLLQAIGRQIDAVTAKQRAIEELVNSIIGVVGVEPVSAELAKNREEEAIAKAKAQQEETDRLKAEGVLESVGTVQADSVVILTERREDGTEVPPGWFRLHMSEVKEEFRDALLGKTVGEGGKLENGSTFTILEILKVNPSQAVKSAQKDN